MQVRSPRFWQKVLYSTGREYEALRLWKREERLRVPIRGVLVRVPVTS